jgi:peptide/nickel transport system permease protein
MALALTRVLLRAALTIFLAVVFTFIIMRVSGDPLYALLPLDTPPVVIEHFRKLWALDQPLPVQFLTYLQGISHGDFGQSLTSGDPSLPLVLSKAPATLELMAVSLIIAVVVGGGLGTLAATKRGSLIDRGVIALAVLAHSMPNFLIAILLILLFAVALHLLPSGGGDTPAHLILPSLVIGLANAGIIARFVRSSMLEVMGQRYVLVARAKRLDRWAILAHHVAPNAALPLLTVLGFLVGGMIGGSAIVETVFAWPGLGRFLVTSVAYRDLPVVQTIVILIACTMVAANLLVDLLHVLVDPRLRRPKTV